MNLLDHPTFLKKVEIHRNIYKNMTSPKYDEFELEARAQVNSYIQFKMQMNFHQMFEQAFILGAHWALAYKAHHPEAK